MLENKTGDVSPSQTNSNLIKQYVHDLGKATEGMTDPEALLDLFDLHLMLSAFQPGSAEYVTLASAFAIVIKSRLSVSTTLGYPTEVALSRLDQTISVRQQPQEYKHSDSLVKEAEEIGVPVEMLIQMRAEDSSARQQSAYNLYLTHPVDNDVVIVEPEKKQDKDEKNTKATNYVSQSEILKTARLLKKQVKSRIHYLNKTGDVHGRVLLNLSLKNEWFGLMQLLMGTEVDYSNTHLEYESNSSSSSSSSSNYSFTDQVLSDISDMKNLSPSVRGGLGLFDKQKDDEVPLPELLPSSPTRGCSRKLT